MTRLYHLAHILLHLLMCTICASKDFTAPKMWYPNKPERLYYTIGNTASIPCNVTGSPNVWYKWAHNGQDIKNSSYRTVNTKSGHLNIIGFSASDGGSYRCFAITSFGGDIQNRSVTIMSPAVHLLLVDFQGDVGQEISSFIVDEYGYAFLECAIHEPIAANDITYTWIEAKTLRNVDLSGGRIYIDIHGRLHFTYILLKDNNTGGYKCIKSTRLGNILTKRTSPIYKLNVIPAVDGENQTACYVEASDANLSMYSHRECDGISICSIARQASVKPKKQCINTDTENPRTFTAVLECVFSGYDQNGDIPFQYWLLPNNKQLPASEKYEVSHSGRRLTIYNARVSDSQTYACGANTSVGYDIRQVTINITALPGIFIQIPKDVIVLEGTNVTFQCDTRSNFYEQPAVKTQWYFNGGKIKESEIYNITDNNKTLTIKTARKEFNTGCFQCEVSDDKEADRLWANACLFVLKRIHLLRPILSVFEIPKGEFRHISVLAITDVNLDLKYQWLVRGKCLYDETMPDGSCKYRSNTLLINTSGKSNEELDIHRGKYTIIISNKYEKVYEYTMVVIHINPVTKSGNQSDPLIVIIVVAALGLLVVVNGLYTYKIHLTTKTAKRAVQYNVFTPKPSRYRRKTRHMFANMFDEHAESSTSIDPEPEILENLPGVEFHRKHWASI